MASSSTSTALTPQEVAVGVLRKGLLLKQGAKIKSWKERWFVLLRDRLAYFDPSDYDPLHPNPNVGGDLVGKGDAINSTGRAASVDHGPGSSSNNSSSSSSLSSSSSSSSSGSNQGSSAPPLKDKAKGVLALSDITSVSSLRSRGAFQVSVAANPSTGVAERDYLLVAPSDTDRKHWMESIQRAMLAPSRAALVLRQTRELHRRGQLCSREGEVISALLMSGREEDVEAAVEAMTAASQVPAADRGSDRLESLLVDFRIADSEAELMKVLQSLKTVLEEEDTNNSVRDRVVDIAMKQYAASTEKLAQALEAQRISGGSSSESSSSSSSSESSSSPSSSTSGATPGGLTSPNADGSSRRLISTSGSSSLMSKAGNLFRMSSRMVSAPQPSSSPSPAAPAPSSATASASSAEESSSGYGQGTRRRESPVLSLYGGVSPSHSTVTSGAVKWSATIQDMFSLVLHTIAMRVHAHETGDAGALEGLVPQGSEDEDDAAAAGDDDEATREKEEATDSFDSTGKGRGGASPGKRSRLGGDAGASSSSSTPGVDVSAITLSPTDPLAALREDGVVTKDYQFGEKLGEGAYSVVYRARHLATGEQVAIKVAKKAALTPAELRRLVDEVGIMAGLDHVHIVRLHAFYEDASSFYIISECCDGGELFDRIVQRTVYSEREARDIVRTLAEALDYMCSQGIVHRDLKPENILLSSPEEGKALIKIADMGFAKRLHPSYYAYFDQKGIRRPESFSLPPPEDVQQKRAAQLAAMQQQQQQQASSASSSSSSGAASAPAPSPSSLPPWDPSELGLTTSCGTPSYVSPEILLGKPYGPQVDMWSLGVISYILLCGYAPFAASNQTDLFRAIVAGKFQFDSPYWDRVSIEAKDLIRKLLVVDPTRRATAREVLQHRWLQGTVSSVELSSALAQMRLFQASRKQIIRRGELRKVGHFVRNTKKRMFILTSDSLEYYEPAEASSRPKSTAAAAPPAPSSFSSSSSSAAAPPPSLGGAGASTIAASLPLSSSAASVLSDDSGSTSTPADTASVVSGFSSSAPSLARSSSNREVAGVPRKESSDSGAPAAAAAGGFPALLASLGFFGAAAATKPKGSIPIRDVRGVVATDHLGKDLPPQRVVSVSLGRNGSSATITPSHFKDSAPSLASSSSSTDGQGSSVRDLKPGAAAAAAANNTFSPSFGALPAPSPPSGSFDDDDDNSDKGTVYTAFTSAPPALSLSSSASTTSSAAGGDVGSARAGTASMSAAAAAFNPSSAFWFKVQTSSGRDYLLAADSQVTREEWMRAITFTVQRWDLIRKAQVALAGERMAEAVALMRLAQDWSTLMELPGSSSSSSSDSKAFAFGGSSGAKRTNPLPGASMASVSAANATIVSSSSSSSSSGAPPKPGQIANTLSTVALRTFDPLEGDVGRSTRIVSKVTMHQAKCRARGSLLDLAAKNIVAFAASAAALSAAGSLPLPGSSPPASGSAVPVKGAGAVGGMANANPNPAASPSKPSAPPQPLPPSSPPPAVSAAVMMRRHGTCGEADEVGSPNTPAKGQGQGQGGGTA